MIQLHNAQKVPWILKLKPRRNIPHWWISGQYCLILHLPQSPSFPISMNLNFRCLNFHSFPMKSIEIPIVPNNSNEIPFKIDHGRTVLPSTLGGTTPPLLASPQATTWPSESRAQKALKDPTTLRTFTKRSQQRQQQSGAWKSQAADCSQDFIGC